MHRKKYRARKSRKPIAALSVAVNRGNLKAAVAEGTVSTEHVIARVVQCGGEGVKRDASRFLLRESENHVRRARRIVAGSSITNGCAL